MGLGPSYPRFPVALRRPTENRRAEELPLESRPTDRPTPSETRHPGIQAGRPVRVTALDDGEAISDFARAPRRVRSLCDEYRRNVPSVATSSLHPTRFRSDGKFDWKWRSPATPASI